MPHRTFPFLPNHYYHLYNRGNNRQPIFFERDNYLYFLQGIKKYLFSNLDIIAYCLMPTHYHLLVRVKTSEVFETSEVSLNSPVSSAMQKFIISYTKAINKRFNRCGALFQGQFQAKLVTSDEQLVSLCYYIHSNPVKDKLVLNPEDWEFSDYQDWIKNRTGRLVDHKFIQSTFGSNKYYQSLLEEYIFTSSDFRNLGDFGSFENQA